MSHARKKTLNVSVRDRHFSLVVKGLPLGVINGSKLKYEINDFVLDFRSRSPSPPYTRRSRSRSPPRRRSRSPPRRDRSRSPPRRDRSPRDRDRRGRHWTDVPSHDRNRSVRHKCAIPWRNFVILYCISR